VSKKEQLCAIYLKKEGHRDILVHLLISVAYAVMWPDGAKNGQIRSSVGLFFHGFQSHEAFLGKRRSRSAFLFGSESHFLEEVRQLEFAFVRASLTAAVEAPASIDLIPTSLRLLKLVEVKVGDATLLICLDIAVGLEYSVSVSIDSVCDLKENFWSAFNIKSQKASAEISSEFSR
jgi:hypothetical protein